MARTLLKKTSRGKNPAWYRDAVQLDHQLHLFESPTGFLSFFYNLSSGEVSSLKPLPGHSDQGALTGYLEYLRSEVLPEKSRGLGVILHLNHEASVFEFPQQEWAETHPGKSLPDLLAEDPAEVLQDRTLSESTLAFRIFPTPANPNVEEFGCAIAASSRGEELLAGFRAIGAEENYPIRTHGLSSPPLLVSRLPRSFGAQEGPFCVLLRYEAFSFVAYFRADGELILVRSVKHANGALPHNFESVLATTAASIELPTLAVKAFDCRLTKTVPLKTELIPLLLNIDYEVEVPKTNPISAVEEGEGSTGQDSANLPIELVAYLMDDSDPSLAFAETETFGENLKEGYHLQNFLEIPPAERDAMPGAADMKILRIGRILTRVGIAACLLIGLSLAFSAFTKTRSEEWTSAKGNQVQAATAAKDLRDIKAKEQLLADRSKGWVAMEVLARLFPLDGTFQFQEAKYEVVPITAADTDAKAGFTRSWTVNGLSRKDTTETLMKRNSTEGMSVIFEAAEAATGNASLDLSQNTRNLLVDLNFSDNEVYDSAAERGRDQSFAYKFSLSIKQRIEGADPLAIPITQL